MIWILVATSALRADLDLQSVSDRTVDLPAGTVVCLTGKSAEDYAAARQRADRQALEWLSGGACALLPGDFESQRVLAETRLTLVVELSNGRWSRQRYVVKSEPGE